MQFFNKKRWTPFFIILMCFLVLTACQSNQKEEAGPSQTPESSNETIPPDNDASDPKSPDHKDPADKDKEDANSEQADPGTQQDPVTEKNNDLDKERYYVDLDNFRIYPVDKENDKKIVLLTFDDGPKGESTTKILNILDKYDAKAIWFISGFNYVGNEEKQQRFIKNILEIKKRGHIIGNHTWDHENLRNLSEEEQKEQIVKLNKLLKSITGETPKYFRPPNAGYTDFQIALTNKLGMQWMDWSLGSKDWIYKDPAKIEPWVMERMHSGANILFHDKEITAGVLDGILHKLKEQGYEFVLPTEVKIDTGKTQNAS